MACSHLECSPRNHLFRISYYQDQKFAPRRRAPCRSLVGRCTSISQKHTTMTSRRILREVSVVLPSLPAHERNADCTKYKECRAVAQVAAFMQRCASVSHTTSTRRTCLMSHRRLQHAVCHRTIVWCLAGDVHLYDI